MEQTYQSYDKMVDLQKKAVQKINCIVFCISLGVSVYMVVLVVLYLMNTKELTFLLFQEIIIIFINFVLIYSVSSIRSTIKSIEEKFPNDKLMVIHLFNFVVYTIIFLTVGTLKTLCSTSDQQSDSPNYGNFNISQCEGAFYMDNLENLFYNYMTLFLMYLIIRFSAQRLSVEKNDPCLGRSVPIIVYIQNQKPAAAPRPHTRQWKNIMATQTPPRNG